MEERHKISSTWMDELLEYRYLCFKPCYCLVEVRKERMRIFLRTSFPRLRGVDGCQILLPLEIAYLCIYSISQCRIVPVLYWFVVCSQFLTSLRSVHAIFQRCPFRDKQHARAIESRIPDRVLCGCSAFYCHDYTSTHCAGCAG